MALLLEVEIPEQLKTTLELAGYSPETLEMEARRMPAASLYTRNILSLAQAAQLAALPVREFIPFLASLGLPVFHYPPEELAHDVESIQWQVEGR
jgi:predicted HTH domain antitoxin